VNPNNFAFLKVSNCPNVSEMKMHMKIYREKWKKRKLKMFVTLANKSVIPLPKNTNAKIMGE
jgi:hypothetical protein